MDNKKLEQGSRYEAHDLDGDGIVLMKRSREKEMIELELREERNAQQGWRGLLWAVCLYLQQCFTCGFYSC